MAVAVSNDAHELREPLAQVIHPLHNRVLRPRLASRIAEQAPSRVTFEKLPGQFHRGRVFYSP
jgi:hypothetical protein